MSHCTSLLWLCCLTFAAKNSAQIDREYLSDVADLRVIAEEISRTTSARVVLDGSKEFESRRVVDNGLCRYIRPGIITVPRSTLDVSSIVRIARNPFRNDC